MQDNLVGRPLPALPRSVLEPAGPGGEPPRLTAVRATPLQLSPYPLWYTLLWPWFFRRPSTANRTGMPILPRRFQRAGAGGQPTIRLCAIGDILPMQRDRIPVFDPALQRLFATADLIVGTCEAAIGRSDCDPTTEYGFTYSLGNFCSDIGIGWTAHPPVAARMCSVLTIELGTEGAHRGRVVGYELHLFVQVDDGERVSLVPLADAPAQLRDPITARAAIVLAP